MIKNRLSYFKDKYVITKSILLILAYLSGPVFLYAFLNSNHLLNIELMMQVDFSKILTLIIGSLTTLLAIIFALSQFILSNIVEKYSTQIIEKYEKSSKNKLFILYIFIIIFSFLLLAIPNLNTYFPLYYLIIISLIIYLFIISFVFLVDYISYMFILINPLKFADIQKNDIMEAIFNQKEEDIKFGIIAMGDITIKLMRKGEEKACLKYISYLKEIFLDFMELRVESEMYLVEVFRIFEAGETRNNVLSYILNEYFRIYKESTEKKQDVISNNISDNLFSILVGVIYDEW